jgi:anti-anti-sigma factor
VKQQMLVIRLADAVMVWLSGPVDRAVTPAMRDALRRLIDRQSRPFVLDLTEVPAIDDAAVSVLAAASTHAGRAGGIDLRLPRGRRHLVNNATTLRAAIDSAFRAA